MDTKKMLYNALRNYIIRNNIKLAHDEDVWRTTEEGHRVKLDDETGEIKAGFGGKFTGQKVSEIGKSFTGPKSPSGGTKMQTSKTQSTSSAQKTFSLKDGLDARIEYTGTYMPESPIDGGYGGTEKEHYSENFNVVILKDGKEVCKGNLNDFFESKDNDANLSGYLHTPDGKQVHLKVKNSSLSTKQLREAAEKISDENANSDIKRLKSNATEAKRKSDIEAANWILSVKNVFPDEQSRKNWERRYNDAMNEGGEGYIPRSVTQAEIEWARKTLASQGK